MRECFHQPFISNQQEVWLRCANGTLVQLKVVENEKFITQNYKILGQESVHIQNIMGLIKTIKKDCTLVLSIGRKRKKIHLGSKAKWDFFSPKTWKCRQSYRDKGSFCCTFLRFLQLMYLLPI